MTNLSVTLSVVRSLGEPAGEMHFVRHGEQLSVNSVPAGPHPEASAD